MRIFQKFIQTRRKKFLTKRQKFAAITVVAVLGLIATQLASQVEYYFRLSIGLSLIAGILSYIVLRSDAKGIRKVTSSLLIVFYTAGISFFYILLPVRWLTRLPTAVLFGIGFYAILLTENIFNVASGRTIQLLRAARSIGLLVSMLTVYLFFETIISLHLPFYANAVIVGIVSFPIIFHNLWYMELDSHPKERLFFISFVLAVVLAELALVFSFWPTASTVQALFLTSFFYLTVGLVQQNLIDRLFPQTIKEFITVTSIVFFLVFITTNWKG